MGILTIDHIVLTVKSVDASKYFYCDILGMEYEEFMSEESTKPRACLKFGNQKINLHQIDNLIHPGANNPTTGSADICFTSNKNVKEWILIFEKENIDIVKGPVDQLGAIKQLNSIYVRDPDLNLVEIANYK